MSNRSIVVTVSLLLGCFALTVPASAKVTPEQKCAVAKMKAAGKRLGAEAKCFSKALLASTVVDPACLAAAATKFAETFAKAETGDCLHVGDSGSIGTKIGDVIDDIVGDVGCGDGAEQGDEQCDDGNVIDGDGCSSTCTPGAIAVCGDGTINGTEECDDGGISAGDGCSATCSVELGFTCTGQPSVCAPIPTCAADYTACGVDADCCSAGATCLAPGFCLPPVE
jgi:cysteine-rich repeat protein